MGETKVCDHIWINAPYLEEGGGSLRRPTICKNCGVEGATIEKGVEINNYIKISKEQFLPYDY
jgi:hypothetical protein